jgi:short-subunit dehydrogenase
VSTEFQARAGIKLGFEHEILKVSASDVAQAGYRGLMANKRAVLPGLGIKMVPFMLRLFPRGFVLRRSAAFSCESDEIGFIVLGNGPTPRDVGCKQDI